MNNHKYIPIFIRLSLFIYIFHNERHSYETNTSKKHSNEDSSNLINEQDEKEIFF